MKGKHIKTRRDVAPNMDGTAMPERCRNTWKIGANKNLAPERRRLDIFAEAQRRSTFQLTVTLSQASYSHEGKTNTKSKKESMTGVNYSFPD